MNMHCSYHYNDSNDSDDIIFTDVCSKSNKKICYIRIRGSESSILVKATNIASWNIFANITSVLKDIFLPKGYPNSVSSDYLEYQIWDTCQAFCSSISGTLTMRAVMQGIGVGIETATPASAAITWIMKDGTGMIGSILFAWLKGSKLDSDCKKWRLFADILNDIAMFTEFYIPFLMDYSMHMLCVATVFKALVGTAGSSTRAALVTHQAIKGNIADVSAKDGSQEIFVNLCAFIFGVYLLKNVTESEQVWTVMCTAIFFHLIFNYKAVRCLEMNVFNSERFCLGLRAYLPTSVVPSVKHINKRESVFLLMGVTDSKICDFSIQFGLSLKKVISKQSLTASQFFTLTTFFQHENYFIMPCVEKKKLYVTFRQHFKDNEVLKAYFHASLIAISLTYLQKKKTLHIISRSRKNSPIYRLKNILNESDHLIARFHGEELLSAIIMQAYIVCEDFVHKEFTAFSKSCEEQGWDLNKHLINIHDWRADWPYKAESQDKIINISRSPRVKIQAHAPEKKTFSANTRMNVLIIS